MMYPYLKSLATGTASSASAVVPPDATDALFAAFCELDPERVPVLTLALLAALAVTLGLALDPGVVRGGLFALASASASWASLSSESTRRSCLCVYKGLKLNGIGS
jgi:hypothetical protein